MASKMVRQSGVLAREYGQKRLPVTVLQSNKGFYIGTVDPDEGPFSRESEEYFASQSVAEQALSDGAWTQRDQP